MPAERQLSHRNGGEHATRDRERRIAELATTQHGVVARRQLVAEGFSDREIDRRVSQRRLHVIHRAVFAVGRRPLTVEGWWMAAVLAAGPGAVLSHRPAAALRGLMSWTGVVDVTARARRGPRRGIRFHRGQLLADERCVHDEIPVTTVARTLLDLASVLDRERLHQAVAKAEALELTDAVPLPTLLERHRGRRGIAALREIVADRRLGLDVSRSDLEIDFRSYLRERDLPLPEQNVWLDVGGRWIQVDCLWRKHGVVAELDGRVHHLNAHSFEDDRARDRDLIAAGLVPLRITWRALHIEPDALERALRAALSRRAT